MCIAYKETPDSPFFEEMDPWVRLWLYYSWRNKQELKIELAKSHAVLIGSFYDPEKAQKIAKRDDPDFASTEEDEQASMDIVRQARATEEDMLNGHRRKRKKVIKR